MRFLDPTGKSPQAYGVLGLVNPIEEFVGPNLPIYVSTVLLPLEGKIIYDGLIVPYNVFFGGGIGRDLNDSYRNVQERRGIITSLTPDGDVDIDDLRKARLVSVAKKGLGGPRPLEGSVRRCGQVKEFHKQHKHLYLSANAPSINSVPLLVKIRPAQVVNIQPAATDKAEPFGQEWLMEPLLGHNPGQRSFQFGAGLLHIKPLHRVHRLVFGRFGVEFFGILHPRFAVQHDEAVGHFNARNRRLRI